MFQVVRGDAPQEPGGDDVPHEKVVELARQGDRNAFTTLFHLFNAPICTYLARLVGNDEVGRDLAQETFLRAWKSLPGLEGTLQFKPWLYRIATNVAHSYLRRVKIIRWLPWSEREEETLSIAGPEEQVGEVEAIRKALAYLAPRCRTCLMLQLVGGFSQYEIAMMLNISERSVGAYVCRGREQFRTMYQRLKGAEDE